jgi:AraC-like DNA-binding protein
VTMAAPQLESRLDRATFRRSCMFGGIDLMSARFVRHSFAPHSHDELMIGVIHAGVKAFRCGRSREFAAPGSLSVVNPGEMHTGEREHGPELAYAALYVPQSALARISSDLEGVCSIIRQPVIDDPDIWRCLALAHQLAMAGDDAVAGEEAMTWGVSLLFQRYGESRLFHSQACCPRTVNRALEFLQACACDHISLEDASKAAGVGLFHLIRLFRRHLGLTPHAYLTQIRIAKSRQLLRLGEPVAQVALDVGFADQAHFTKRFKQLTGTTPALYARSMQ